SHGQFSKLATGRAAVDEERQLRRVRLRISAADVQSRRRTQEYGPVVGERTRVAECVVDQRHTAGRRDRGQVAQRADVRQVGDRPRRTLEVDLGREVDNVGV